MPSIQYRFQSQEVGTGDDLIVVDFTGFEAISEPYEFVINLKSENAEIDLEAMVGSRCTFEMEFDGDIKKYHGILSEFDQLHQIGKYTMYRATLVPRLWLLSLYQTNEIYLDKNIQDIIEVVFEECDIPSLDYKINLSSSYPTWEFRCQFGETHLDFLSRLMEHQGIYYYFEQSDNSETIIICDTMQSQESMKDSEVNYGTLTGLDKHMVFNNIYSLVCRQTRIPKKMMLRDYNYEKPSLNIEGSADMDSKSVGEVFTYGDNFETPEEGQQLAKVRAEEMISRKIRYHGDSAVFRMSPGYNFDMKKHFRENFNQSYLVLRIEHEGKLPSHLTGDSEIPDYANRFSAIPAKIQFRSDLKTTKPRFFGAINAIIDAEQSGKYAELDDQGRYKVLLPFDRIRDHEGGKASHWVRMAQPFGGLEEGMFFSLRKGTEVLLTFINGDPDQPIISSVVPNGANPSMVTSDNQTKNRIRTSSGNLIELEDKENNSRIKLFSPNATTYMHLGAADPDGEGLVTMTTGIRRSNHLGGTQKTIVTSSNTEEIPASVQTDIANADQNNAGTSTTDTTQPNIVTEQDIWSFVKREVGDGHGKSADGTTTLTADEEITGDYVIDRTAGTRYSWASGHEFNYGTGNIYNFGNSLETCHWNQSATDESKKLVDTMYGYELTGIKEYGGDDISADSSGSKWKTLVNKGQVSLTESDAFSAHNGNIYDFGGCWNYNLGNGYEENHMSQGQQEMNKQYTQDKAPAGPPESDSYKITHLESHGPNVGVSKTIKAPSYDYSTESPSVEVAYKCDSFSYTYGGVQKEWLYTSGGTKLQFSETDADSHNSKTEYYSQGGTLLRTEEEDYSSTVDSSFWTLSAESEFSATIGAKSSMSLAISAENDMSITLGAKNTMNLGASIESEISITAGLSSSISLKAALSFSADMVAGVAVSMEVEPTKIELEPWSFKVKSPALDLNAAVSALLLKKDNPMEITAGAMKISQDALKIKCEQSIQT